MRRFTALITALILCLISLYVHAEAPTDDAVDNRAAEKNAPLRLLSELYEGQNMLVYSPISLSVALGMAAEGASGETAEQLNAFLGDKRPDWFDLEDLSFSGAKLAGAVFVHPETELLPSYEDALSDSYAAEPICMETGNTMNQVNNWVSDATDGLINSMLSEEPSSELPLLLISALHMNADWSSPFAPSDTLASVFHAPQADIEVSSMNQRGTFAYREENGIQSILLPYRGSSLEMLILLPEDGNLQNLIDSICTNPDEFIQEHLPGDEATVLLSLPNVRAESSFDLTGALIRMGVTDAFSPADADFSGMTGDALSSGLHIGSVVQKAFLNVNESGTEAAAATSVSLEAGAAFPGNTVVMNVDRPFMMLVMDTVSGYVLFAACINNPA